MKKWPEDNKPAGFDDLVLPVVQTVKAAYKLEKKPLKFGLTYNGLPLTSCILGIPLFLTEGRRGPNSYSIDRVDNSKGYTKENTRVISFLANSRKGDLTLDQVEAMLRYMKS